MAEPLSSPRSPRDARLLLLTLILSVAVLIFLAQFRFPDRPRTPSAPLATALDQLALRSAFDDQATAIRELARRVSASLVRLRTPAGSQDGRELLGLRFRDDLVIVKTPADGNGSFDAAVNDRWVAAPVVARDLPRRLAVIRVPGSTAPSLTVADTPPALPGFVAAVGGDGAGPDIRPVWIGHLAVVPLSTWPGQVLRIPSTVQGLPDGSFVFSMQGAFVGLSSNAGDEQTLVPARLVLDRGALLAGGRSFTGADAGLLVQDLTTAALRTAAGGREGALIAAVDPDGPAADQLQPGDLIVQVENESIRDARDFLQALARREPGTSMTITVARNDAPLQRTLTLREPPGQSAASPDGQTGGPPTLGATLRQRGEEIEVLAVRADGPAAAAGIAPGDRITWIEGVDQPTPAALERAFAGLERGGVLLVRLGPNPQETTPRTRTRSWLVAIQKP